MASVAGSLTASPVPATHVKIPFDRLVAYATLQLPLAMAALPVVLNVPKFYGETLGLSLGALGVFLLITRVIDALQDPVIGWVSDRLTLRRNGRLLLVGAMVPVLGAGFVALFDPPSKEVLGITGLSIWLVVSLIVVHLGYAGVSISYHAHGAELSDDYNERTRITVAREVFGLVGMTLAVVTPAILINPGLMAKIVGESGALWLFGASSEQWHLARAAVEAAKASGVRDAIVAADQAMQAARHASEISGYHVFALLFIPVLAATAFPSLFFSPTSVHGPVRKKGRASIFHDFMAPLKNPRFRRLLMVFVVNGSALGIAVSVMLFYVEHVLAGSSSHAGIVLLTYFISGAASVPLWLWVSRHISKAAAWFLAMVLTVVASAGALFLGAGDIWPFVALSVLTGIGIGADYGLPPSILADIIHAEEGQDTRGETGAYFGLWALATKLATAVGAAMSLPVAQLLGFNPAKGAYNTTALIVVYILLPMAVKAIAAALIWYIKIEALRPAAREVLLRRG